jgi:hypothetical protein
MLLNVAIGVQAAALDRIYVAKKHHRAKIVLPSKLRMK